MAEVTLQKESLMSPAAWALITELNAELDERYPEDNANFFRLDEAEVAPGHGAFFVAYVEGEPAGCGAVRCLDGVKAEIKRMYVAPPYRGQGLGRALLVALEAEARSLGLGRLILEAGERQPEALGLYRSAGFDVIPNYSESIDAPLSLCMGKELR
jgi:GNAT superfamily N-acetyltransferase